MLILNANQNKAAAIKIVSTKERRGGTITKSRHETDVNMNHPIREGRKQSHDERKSDDKHRQSHGERKSDDNDGDNDDDSDKRKRKEKRKKDQDSVERKTHHVKDEDKTSTVKFTKSADKRDKSAVLENDKSTDRRQLTIEKSLNGLKFNLDGKEYFIREFRHEKPSIGHILKASDEDTKSLQANPDQLVLSIVGENFYRDSRLIVNDQVYDCKVKSKNLILFVVPPDWQPINYQVQISNPNWDESNVMEFSLAG